MSDQLPLIGPRGGLRPRAARRRSEPAGAQVGVIVDSRLPQLDRVFDFAVPLSMAGAAVPGVRVRVPLGGRTVSGFVVSRADPDDRTADLAVLSAVTSQVPVLTQPILELSRAVAGHYAGSVSDVLRLAVPPRVAGAEEGWAPMAGPAHGPSPSGWLAGQPAVSRAAHGEVARAAWCCPAGTDWPRELAAAAMTVAAADRGVIIIVPDARDVARVDAALRMLGASDAVSLRADDPDRYQRFLRILAGQARIVVGTRAAAFAPVHRLGLALVWDDGDPSHAEQRAPYPHSREVLALRSHIEGAGLVVAGFARTCEAQRWVAQGWLAEISDRSALRSGRPLIRTASDDRTSPLDANRRFPDAAVQAIRQGLERGPALIQVPRRGHIPVTACQDCRELAVCPTCGGTLETGPEGPRCRRCGATDAFHCPWCGGQRLRAVQVGVSRTAEEVQRLFTVVPVDVSTAESPIGEVGPEPRIVVATPGVEPVAATGYSAAYLPDASADLWRPDLRARENALRRWMAASALVRAGAPVVINADGAEPVVQSLIRWDPVGLAQQELESRTALRMPPAQPLVQLDGTEQDVTDMVAGLTVTVADLDVMGPIEESPGRLRVLVRSGDRAHLVAEVRRIAVTRATHRTGSPVRVQVDPAVIN